MSLYIYPNWKICTVCDRLYPPKIIFRLNKLGVDAFRVDTDKMVKGLLPQVRLDVYFPGFPTLKHIPHKVKLSISTFESIFCHVQFFKKRFYMCMQGRYSKL